VLGRRIDREAGTDLVARHGGDVDDVPGFLTLHVWQGRGDAVEHTLDVHVDHPVPLVDLEAFKWRLRHQPGVVHHDVDTPVRLNGGIDESLHLVAVGDVCRYGECLAAAAGQLVGQRPEPFDPPCPQHNAPSLGGEEPGGRLAQPAARARDDDDMTQPVGRRRTAPVARGCPARSRPGPRGGRRGRTRGARCVGRASAGPPGMASASASGGHPERGPGWPERSGSGPTAC
jgi:hypothetical protein